MPPGPCHSVSACTVASPRGQATLDYAGHPRNPGEATGRRGAIDTGIDDQGRGNRARVPILSVINAPLAGNKPSARARRTGSGAV